MNRNFIGPLHYRTKRDYAARASDSDKARLAETACKFGEEYWEDRRCGYGGYRYDGRWRSVAEEIIQTYEIGPGARVLDVGCGQAHLLFEMSQVCPGISIAGIDISDYGAAHAPEAVRAFLRVGNAAALPWGDGEFDLVLSVNALHNLMLPDLWSALTEIERVCNRDSFICVEGYTTEQEKLNLLAWQMTCRAFHTPAEWEFLFSWAGYIGDWECVTFPA